MKLSINTIAKVSIMVAIIEAGKIALQSIPNVETTTFFLMMFTLHMGKSVFYVVPVFILIEGAIYGINLWWIMYAYIWPLLIIITGLLKKYANSFNFACISGAFGLLFGLMCSFVYFFIGLFTGGIRGGFNSMFPWFVAGIPYDILHGIANFIIMFTLFNPANRVLTYINRRTD